MIRFMKKNAPYKHLILLLLLFCFFSGLGQAPGYLGRRTSLSLGIGQPVFRLNDKTNKNYYSGVFPELTLTLERSSSYTKSWYIRMGYYTMPDYYVSDRIDSTITQQCPWPWGGIHWMTKEINRTTYLRNRIVFLTAGYRNYREASPMGGYWDFGIILGMSMATSYSTDTVIIYDEYHSLGAIEHYLEKHPPDNDFRSVYGVSIGKGRHIIVSDRVMLDYGCRFNWHFDFKNALYFILEDFNYAEKDQETYNRIQGKKLFELYLNIGFLIK
jgi:hypothetical protein